MYEDGLRKAVRGITDVRGSAARHARRLTAASRAEPAPVRACARAHDAATDSMPIFRYKAVNAAGDVATGELDAANESEIVERLRDQGMLPMQVARATGTPSRRRAGARAEPPPRRRWFASKHVTPRSAARDHARARDAAAAPACRSIARSRS